MSKGSKHPKAKAMMLGLGLDSDGSKRITTGPNVALVGGSKATHEAMTEKAKTNHCLTFPATLAAVGDYTVAVSDANGSVVIDPAKLSFLAAPTFVQPPVSMKPIESGCQLKAG